MANICPKQTYLTDFGNLQYCIEIVFILKTVLYVNTGHLVMLSCGLINIGILIYYTGWQETRYQYQFNENVSRQASKLLIIFQFKSNQEFQ